MASNVAELDDHQKFVLMKFRRNVADITKPYHDDKFLLRWLRARSWDPQAAEKMLRQSMKWRQQWEVDETLKTWQPPDQLPNYFPCGLSGYSKEGAPVIIVPYGGFDMAGVLQAYGRQDLVKMTIQTLEKYMAVAAEQGIHKVVVVFDVEGFNIRQYAWRPAAEQTIAMIQMYEANYPEVLIACYIINAPRVFAVAFNVVKKFLNECTLGKMQIFKTDPKKWKKALLEHIDPDNLPKHYGGNLEDPDGNSKYTSLICYGGKVPKHLYKKHFNQNPDTATARHFVTAVIKKGEKLTLDFMAADEGCFLKWEFRTEDHDIRFGVTMKDADGNTTSVVRHKRIAAHQIDESGVIACQAPATYTITFDNSYSLLRSKKLHYDVALTPPIEKFHILPQDEENTGTGEAVATTSASS